MSLASRYLFETSFDVARGGPAAAAAPVPTPEEIEAEQARLRREETERALIAIRAEGFAEGRRVGLAEGLARAEEGHTKDMLSLMEHVVESLTLLGQQEAQSRQRADAAAIDCATSILGRMVPALAAREGLREIQGLLAECLVQAQDEPRLVLRVPPALFEAMQEDLDRIGAEAAFSGKIVLIADGTLGRNAARLEWADGGAERDPQRLWTEIDGAIARVLSASTPPIFGGGKPAPAAMPAHPSPHPAGTDPDVTRPDFTRPDSTQPAFTQNTKEHTA